MNTKDFWYDLPEKLIAQTPIEPRDHSRLLVVHKNSNEVEHKKFFEIENLLSPNDVLVLNVTKVIPARLFCHKEGNTGKLEVLLLKRIDLTKYEALGKPMRRMPVGSNLIFSKNLKAKVISKSTEGLMTIEFELSEGTLEQELDKIGEMPLPHYIHEKLKDKSRYQTIYAKIDGSSAAPTAGLHFTKQLIEKLKQKGVQFEEVVLDVGLGTFRPVQTQKIEEHHMHTERCFVSEKTAKNLNEAKKQGKRIVAVGTTSVRTLETASKSGKIQAGEYNTNIFIYPGKKFDFVDAMITNFHLPESTLIMLVSAFLGTEKTIETYKLAVKEKYRFFSFGDAMFISD